MNKPRIIFFGTPTYSITVLNKLIEAGYSIALVVTKPPGIVGRNKILTETPVAQFAQKHNLPLYTPQTHAKIPNQYKDPEEVTEEILKYKPELLIVANYTRMIPQELIQKTLYGGLNIHPSLLPSYKGPAPIPWALMQGETKMGVSIVTLANQFDSGNIISQAEYPITKKDTTETLLKALFTLGAEILIQHLPNYLKDKNKFIISPYPNSQFPRLNRETGFEPWEKITKAVEVGEDAERIERKFRALHPWPGLWTTVKAKSGNDEGRCSRLKIIQCHLHASSFTPQANLVLDQVQFEGKKPEDVTSIEDIS